jgi:hypothetical protein
MQINYFLKAVTRVVISLIHFSFNDGLYRFSNSLFTPIRYGYLLVAMSGAHSYNPVRCDELLTVDRSCGGMSLW